jgi:hypothetical protein
MDMRTYAYGIVLSYAMTVYPHEVVQRMRKTIFYGSGKLVWVRGKMQIF